MQSLPRSTLRRVVAEIRHVNSCTCKAQIYKSRIIQIYDATGVRDYAIATRVNWVMIVCQACTSTARQSHHRYRQTTVSEYGGVSARQATRGGLRDTRHVLAKAATSQPAARLRSLAAETNFCFDDSLEICARYTCVFVRIMCDWQFLRYLVLVETVY